MKALLSDSTFEDMAAILEAICLADETEIEILN